jgi:hypothetical protein
MKHTWTASYCEGWNGPAGKPVGALSQEEARQRDVDGLPYSVFIAEGGAPRFILDIAWRQNYLARWTFDGEGRRNTRAVFLRLEEGELFERKFTKWQYESSERDGEPSISRETFKRGFDGRTAIYHRNRRGGSGHTSKSEPFEQFIHPAVAFEDWGTLFGGENVPAPVITPSIGHLQFDSKEPRPWNPPVPLSSPYLNDLMAQGSTVIHRDSQQPMVVDRVLAATVNLPTGKVVACDPGWLNVSEAFTVDVAPGTYKVIELQIMRMLEGEEYRPAAGYLLEISEEPTVSWEMALQPGQDLRLLESGHFYGFGVDSGFGSFMDYSAQQPLIDHAGEDFEEYAEGLYGAPHFTVPGTDLDLFAYNCYYGDGSYPTWIGRDASGAVTCFLSDMLIISDGSPKQTYRITFEQDWLSRFTPDVRAASGRFTCQMRLSHQFTRCQICCEFQVA